VIKIANAACKLLGYSGGTARQGHRGDPRGAQFDSTCCRRRRKPARPSAHAAADHSGGSPARASTATTPVQGNIFVARNITDRKRAERQRYLARRRAHQDPQSHAVPSRAAADDAAAAWRRVLAALYLDMDRPRRSATPLAPATRPRGAGRAPDALAAEETVVGRLAGDEFAISVTACRPMPTTAARCAAGARAAHRRESPVPAEPARVFLTASRHRLPPARCREHDHLLRNADAAMYYSKQNGGNTFAFTPGMNAPRSARSQSTAPRTRTRRARDHYQPKSTCAAAASSAPKLAPARSRRHSPGAVHHAAEETNLILISAGGCSIACARLPPDAGQGGVRAAPTVAQAAARRASSCAAARCSATTFPDGLELEITETHMADRGAPCGCSMGSTPWACTCRSMTSAPATPLSALQQFPIGTLKIDQSFGVMPPRMGVCHHRTHHHRDDFSLGSRSSPRAWNRRHSWVPARQRLHYGRGACSASRAAETCCAARAPGGRPAPAHLLGHSRSGAALEGGLLTRPRAYPPQLSGAAR
jgi:hypothetical protein